MYARSSDPGVVPEEVHLTSAEAQRNSDPGPERPKPVRPPSAKPNNVAEALALEVLEEGLNLEAHKDESSKETTYGWADASSLRRGMVILFGIGAVIIVLGLMSGHWYIETKNGVLVIQRVSATLDDYRFREDVDALAQTITLAHFMELAIGLHDQVDMFLDEHTLAREELVEDLQRDLHNHVRNRTMLTKHGNTPGLTGDVHEIDDRKDAQYQAALEASLTGLNEDAKAVMGMFSSSVDSMMMHVDELGDAVDHESNPDLVYSVMGNLIKQTTKKAEGIPSRETLLANTLRPKLNTFFQNYQVFAQLYTPNSAMPLSDELLLGLHSAWTCSYHTQMQIDVHAAGMGSAAQNSTGHAKCELELKQALTPDGADAMSLPGGKVAYLQALEMHSVADYVRNVYYIEHMRRLSRAVITHLNRHRLYHYKCTTCAPEVEVLGNMLSLVQAGSVHPRWLCDPRTVSDQVTLVSAIPESREVLVGLLANNRLVTRLGSTVAGGPKPDMWKLPKVRVLRDNTAIEQDKPPT